MVARLVLITALLLGVASGQLASSRPLVGEPRGCLGTARAASATTSFSAPSRGRGLAAVHRGRLVMVTGTGDRNAFRYPAPRGVLRHAGSRHGIGTALVNDLPGPDVLVVMRPTGVMKIDGRGELTHPAWSSTGDLVWSVDLSRLELWSPGTTARRTVRPPRGASAVFSPVFTAPEELVAIVGEAVGDVHDDALNNLWRYDVGAGRWSRLTRFGAAADRWSVLRTPIVAPDGAVLFVRVRGRANATEQPAFELWRLGEGRVAKIRDLPGEMYLAGFLGRGLVWNVLDGATGHWRLVAEGSGGRVHLGCGAVAVDPVAEPDPDLLQPGAEGFAARDSGDQATSAEPGEGLALLIGDFASESDAGALQEGLRLAGAVVVDHRAAPAAVQPGAWAIAVPISDSTPAEEALARFRARHPDLADLTWIVPFAPREVAA
jgi:hypothetical protein